MLGKLFLVYEKISVHEYGNKFNWIIEIVLKWYEKRLQFWLIGEMTNSGKIVMGFGG